jgi:hypothetical protein
MIPFDPDMLRIAIDLVEERGMPDAAEWLRKLVDEEEFRIRRWKPFGNSYVSPSGQAMMFFSGNSGNPVMGHVVTPPEFRFVSSPEFDEYAQPDFVAQSFNLYDGGRLDRVIRPDPPPVNVEPTPLGRSLSSWARCKVEPANNRKRRRRKSRRPRD